MSKQFDILIKNSRIIDGSGNPSYEADIAIEKGQIAHIRRDIDPAEANSVISAQGMISCPGFIDTHTHDDLLVAVRPTADEKILQGVTTLVVGNCGISVAPIFKGSGKFHQRVLRVIWGQACDG